MKKLLEMSRPRPLPDTLTHSSMPSARMRAEGIECPKCAKRTIVKRSANTFDCLNCDFHKDLPPVAGASPFPIGYSLPSRRQINEQLTYIKGHPNNGRSSLYPTTDSFENNGEPDRLQPFVFAALAVIIGIVLL